MCSDTLVERSINILPLIERSFNWKITMTRKKAQKSPVDTLKTKGKILEAASELFVNKGFNGVSISEIAKKADVNQSLIYHYFDSKEALWKSVKTFLVDSCIDIKKGELNSNLGLQKILEQIISTRFEFYEKNPDLMRMMRWQRLEAVDHDLVGGTRFSPDTWKNIFVELQEKGEIRPEVNLEMMIFFITSVIAGTLTEDHQEKLKNPTYKKDFIDMMLDCLVRSFGQ